jgi:hypothetical protein
MGRKPRRGHRKTRTKGEVALGRFTFFRRKAEIFHGLTHAEKSKPSPGTSVSYPAELLVEHAIADVDFATNSPSMV